MKQKYHIENGLYILFQRQYILFIVHNNGMQDSSVCTSF